MTSNYSYDNLYQLTQVTQGSSTTESYSYDAVGNRLSSLGVSPYAYNSSNELTSTPSATYTYDHNGNTLTKADSSGTTTYNWDTNNQLASVVLPGSGGTVSFKYDPLGRRVQKSGPSGTVDYVYDGDNLLLEVDNSGSVTARYAQSDNTDELLSQLRPSATNYYELDGSWSVGSLSDTSGTLAQTYVVDSFGKRVSSSGSVLNAFQYTARELDTDTGLYYYRARYYDPEAGRFESEDPARFADGVNLYQYVHNNPVLFVDPSGLMRNKRRPIPKNFPYPTFVCDGKGRLRAWVPDWYMYPPERMKCIGDCMLRHEGTHILRVLRTTPTICAGSPDGTQVGYVNGQERDAFEIEAWNVELRCLNNKKNRGPCPECAKYIQDEIDQGNSMLQLYGLGH